MMYDFIMTLLFRKLRRVQSQKVRAVYDDDLIPMLEKLGFLTQIEAGEVKCKYTDEKITLENLHAIVRTADGFDFISTSAVVRGKVK